MKRPALWRRLSHAAAAAFLAFPVLCPADEPLLRSWKTELNGWLFAPAYTADGESVIGFLAWAKPGVPVGDNVAILWYERDPQGGWRVLGWKSDDFISAVDYVRTLTLHPALWADDPEFEAVLNAAGPIVEPVPTQMHMGLFVDDPNAPTFLASPDPFVAVQGAVAAGYPAAPVLSSIATNDGSIAPENPCIASSEVNTSVILDRITFEAETAMWGVSTVLPEDLSEICCWCPCTTHTTYGKWDETRSEISGEFRLCFYTSTETTTRSCSGHHLLSCNACFTHEVVATATVYVQIVVAASEECPNFGGSGTPTGNPPKPYSSIPLY